VSHTIHERQKLLNRVHRTKGQVEAIERALEDVIDMRTDGIDRREWNSAICILPSPS
jgi:hypothetical protein